MEVFEKAPIQEAVLDVFAALPPDVDPSALASFGDHVKERFPIKRNRMAMHGELRFDAGKPHVSGKQQQLGFLFANDDTKRAVQARVDGFSFNKLPPYQDWAAFSAEARELWELYVRAFRPSHVTGVGLRYINRINVPLPLNDFRDYCRLFPDIPRDMSQELASFFMRFSQPLKLAPDGIAIVNVTFDAETSESRKLGLILDIDVRFRGLALEPLSPELKERLELLRAEKNNIFNASVTEKAKDLFR